MIKKTLYCVILMTSATLAFSSCNNRNVSAAEPVEVSEPTDPRKEGKFSPDVVIASYDGAEAKARLMAEAEKIGATVVYDYGNFNMVALRKSEGKTLQGTIETLKQVEGVLGVVEDQMCELDKEGASIALP